MSGVKCYWTFEDLDEINALRAEFRYLTNLVRKIDQDEEFTLTPVSLVLAHIADPFEDTDCLLVPFHEFDAKRIVGEAVPAPILASLGEMVNEEMYKYFLHLLKKRIEVLRDYLRNTYAIEAVA